MAEDLVATLRAGGPVSPAVQMRKLLAFGKQRDWPFETAWRWSFERVKMPHDTAHRREWRQILGNGPFDDRPMPARQRETWKRAYEDQAPLRREQSVGVLLAA